MKDKTEIIKEKVKELNYWTGIYSSGNTIEANKANYQVMLLIDEINALKSQPEPKTNIKKRRTSWRDFIMTDKELKVETGAEEINGRTMNAQEFYINKTHHKLEENCGVRLTGSELFELMNQFVSHCMHDFARSNVRDELKEANELIRSFHSVCERKGKTTNWDALIKKVKLVLEKQHDILYPKNLKSDQ